MTFIIILYVLFGILIVSFLLIEYPYILASLVIFLYLYNLNIDTHLPLDFRGLLMILLFARLLILDRTNLDFALKYLFKEKYFHLIIIFLITSLFVTLFYHVDVISEIKSFVLLSVSLILGFIVTVNQKGSKVFIYSILAAAIFSTIDILYSFGWMGSIHITRLIDYFFTKVPQSINFNYPGLLCGLGFIYSYLFYIRKEFNKIISLSLMILLSMGIVLSTSRSTLLSTIVLIVLIAILQKEIQLNPKVIINFMLLGFVFLLSFYFLYNILLKNNNNEESLVKQVYWRLYEEPAQIFGADENRYDKLSGKEIEGTMTWRYLRSAQDLKKFSTLNLDKQIFGIGVDEYTKTRFGGDIFGAHNGYVLVLVERGICGLILLIVFSIGITIKSLKYTKRYYIKTPIAYLFVMLLIYTVGQNAELTEPLGFLLLGGMIGNLSNYEEYEEENKEIENLKELNKSISSSYSRL